MSCFLAASCSSPFILHVFPPNNCICTISIFITLLRWYNRRRRLKLLHSHIAAPSCRWSQPRTEHGLLHRDQTEVEETCLATPRPRTEVLRVTRKPAYLCGWGPQSSRGWHSTAGGEGSCSTTPLPCTHNLPLSRAAQSSASSQRGWARNQAESPPPQRSSWTDLGSNKHPGSPPTKGYCSVYSSSTN